MKDYSFFKTSYWVDENFRSMSPEQKVIMFFLLTGPHTNWCGVFKVDISMIAFYTGLRPESLENAFRAFLKQFPDLVAYDFETGEVAVLNWAQMNWLSASPNAIKKAMKDLQDVESETLLKRMIQGTKSSKLKEPFVAAFRSLQMKNINDKKLLDSIGVEDAQKCTVMQDKPLIFNDVDVKLKEKDKNENNNAQIDICADDVKNSVCDKPKLTVEEQFEYFWKIYNYKKDRKRAFKVWKKLTLEERRKATLAIKAYDKYLRATNTSKAHPTTYLNNNRWEDDFSIPTNCKNSGKPTSASTNGISAEEAERMQMAASKKINRVQADAIVHQFTNGQNAFRQ